MELKNIQTHTRSGDVLQPFCRSYINISFEAATISIRILFIFYHLTYVFHRQQKQTLSWSLGSVVAHSDCAIRNVKVQFGLPGHGWNRNNGNHIIPTTITPNIIIRLMELSSNNFVRYGSRNHNSVAKTCFFSGCLCLIDVS